jgi:predicted ArsR family transcriptional regulator
MTGQRMIREVGRSQRLQVINCLKRSEGMSVGELSRALKMSYMGVKQHCVGMEREGYLDTWRRPVGVGRPEKVYRLTRRAHDLFPAAANEGTLRLLDAARQLYGPTAPEKLLLVYFKELGDRYAARVRGEVWRERARSLAKLRDEEGHMADFREEEGARIVEHHSPILDLLRAYPAAVRFETEAIGRAVGHPVAREERGASGLYRCDWVFAAG